MKRIHVMALALVVLVIGAAVIYQSVAVRTMAVDESSFLAFPFSAPGTEEDPEARNHWEWMRLHDPQTMAVPPDIRRRELDFVTLLPLARAQNGTWARRGPRNVGGRTRALAVDVSDPTEQTILAVGISGGIWRTTDGGTTWTSTLDPSQLRSGTALVQDQRPGKTHIWYCGTGEWRGNSAGGGGASFRGDGIYKSTDGGLTWALLLATSTESPHEFDQDFDYVWRVVTDLSNPSQDEVYAATYGGIYRSVDGGGSWQAVLEGSSAYTDVAITASGVLYATLGAGSPAQGIWRSTDGINWTNITPAGWPTSPFGRTVIGPAPSDETVAYFLSDTPGSISGNHNLWKYTYLSGDGTGAGGAWENRSSNLPTSPALQSYSNYCLLIGVKPDNANVVFIGAVRLYRSTDGFASTGNTTTQTSGMHVDQHVVTFSPSNPDVMLVGNDGGVYQTQDNRVPTISWTPLEDGYITSQFYTIAIEHTLPGDQTIVGGTQDNGTWFVNAPAEDLPWISIWGGDGAHTAIADGKTYYYVSFQNGNIYRLELDGLGNLLTWAYVNPVGAVSFLFIHPYILDPSDSEIMYLPSGSYIWRNHDLTAIPNFNNSPTTINWTQLTNSVITGGGVISALGASEANPQHRLYYGTSSGRVYRLDGAHTGNPTAVDITDASFPSSAYVSSIAVDPRNANKALVAFSNYNVKSIFSTENGGASWVDVSGNLEENADGSGSGPSVRSVEILPQGNNQTRYFAGASTGLYSATTLAGLATTWEQEGATPIGNVVVDMVDARAVDGFVVAGTHGNGIYSITVSVSPMTRYVATNGMNTGNDCTNPASPCATLSHAVAQANPGDTTDLAAGTYNEPGLVTDKALIIQGQGVVVQ